MKKNSNTFQAAPGQELSIIDGPIIANIEGSVESKTIIYELDSQNFELEDNKDCKITLNDSFNLANLGNNGLFTLSIRLLKI